MQRLVHVLAVGLLSLLVAGCPQDEDFEQNNSSPDVGTSLDMSSPPDDMGSTTTDDTGSMTPDDTGSMDAMHSGTDGGAPDGGSPDGGLADMGTCAAGCPDGVCDPASNRCVECLMPEDCPDMPNSTKSCDANECTYMCEMGFEDDPVTMDACACEVMPEACNGMDEDCDGMPDNGLMPATCTDAMGNDLVGVCAGATVACDGDNQMAYEDGTCSDAMLEMHAAASGELYLAVDDEGWRCDGADNDCDGAADEACCAAGTTPTTRQYGTTRNDDQVAPTLVSATAGAPVDAAYLLVWGEDDTIFTQHIDEAGLPKGLEQSFRTQVETFYSIDVVDTGAGYMLAYAGDEDGTTYRVVLQPLDAMGRETGDLVDVVESQTLLVTSAALETNGTEALLAWSIGDKVASKWDLQTCVFTPGQPTNPCEQSANHRALDTNRAAPYRPSIDANAGGTFAVAWLAANTAAPHDVRSNIVDNTGTPGGAIDLLITDIPDDLRVAVAWQNNTTYHVVATVRSSSGPFILTHIPVTSGIAGSSTDLDTSMRPSKPTVLALDDDGQPGAERLLVAYYHASNDKIVGASLDLSAPAAVTGREIATVRIERDAVFPLARGDRGVGLAWSDSGVNPARVHYTPLSVEGVPVCDTSASPAP